MATKIRGSNFSPSATTTITSIVTENSVDSALVTNLIDSAYIIARASTYDSDNFAGQLAAATTTDLSEGSNLYYTTARFDSDFGDNTTSDLTEGSNLYYTTARFDSDFGDNTTSDLTEGSNLYYTNARADARIAAASITDLSDADQTVRTTDNVSFADVTLTGALNGPSTFYIDPAPVDSDAGLLVIRGDLQVDGTTTTVNSTTVSINDKNIVLADSAANASEADGAGITVNGASATIQYDAVADAWDFNKDVDVTGTVTADGLTVDGNTASNGNLTITTSSNTMLDLVDTSASFRPTIRFMKNDGGVTQLHMLRDDGGELDVKRGTSSLNQARFGSNGDISFYADNGTTQGLFWDASTQRLGLGTTSPTQKLTLYNGILLLEQSTASNNLIRFTENGSESFHLGVDSNAEFHITGPSFTNNKYVTVDTNGNVGIGTTSPSAAIHAYHSTTNVVGNFESGDANAWIQIKDNSTTDTAVMFGAEGDNLLLRAGSNERLRITSAGNVGIGTTSPAVKLAVQNNSSTAYNPSTAAFNTVATLKNTTGGASTNALLSFATEANGEWYIGGVQNSGNTASDFVFAGRNGGTRAERMRIDSSGNVGIGTTSPSSLLHTQGNTELHIYAKNTNSAAGQNSYITLETASSTGNPYLRLISAVSDCSIRAISDGLSFQTGTFTSERARIDSSGSFMAGKSATNIANDGFEAHANNYVGITRNASIPLFLNRRTDDGGLIQFRKNNASVGSIGTSGGHMWFGCDDVGMLFRTNESIRPYNPSTQSERDAAIDLGVSSVRFKDAYLSSYVYASGIAGISDGNTYIRLAGSDVMQFFTGGSERARIDSSGNVGIGTSSPANKLQIVSTTTDPIAYFGKSQTGSASNGLIKLQSGRIPQDGSDTTGESGIIFAHSGGTGGTNFDATGGYIKSIRTSVHSVTANADSALVFATSKDNADTERLRITSGGNVGIGVSTPSGKLHLSNSGAVNQAATIFSLDGYHSTFGANLAKSSGTYTTPATNISGGAWEYQSTNSLNGHGHMIYLSAPDTNSSASTPLERLRIDNSGNLLVGRTSVGSSGTGHSIRGGDSAIFARSGGEALQANRNASDGAVVQFQRSGTSVGSVSVTSSGTTYNTTSDLRLKENIEPLEATDKLMAMNPVSYNWKADPDGPRSMGFIAQEMQEVMPEAVAVGDDEDAMMSMDYGRITPVIVAALQDALKEIDMLKDRIAELEAK